MIIAIKNYHNGNLNRCLVNIIVSENAIEATILEGKLNSHILRQLNNYIKNKFKSISFLNIIIKW